MFILFIKKNKLKVFLIILFGVFGYIVLNSVFQIFSMSVILKGFVFKTIKIFSILFSISILSSYLQCLIFGKLVASLEYENRVNIFRKITNLPDFYYIQNGTDHLNHHFNNYLNSAKLVLQNLLLYFIPPIIFLILILIFIFIKDFQIGIYFSIWIFLSMGFYMFFYFQKQKINFISYETNKNFSGFCSNVLKNFSLNTIYELNERNNSIAQNIGLNIQVYENKLWNLQGIQETFYRLFFGIFFVLVTYKAFKIDFGFFILIAGFAVSFFWTIWFRLEFLSMINVHLGVISSTEKFLKELEEKKFVNCDYKETYKEIEVKNLKYITNDMEIINIPYFKINPLSKVVIEGVSGSGKTTFFHLLTKQLKQTEGEILFNGKNLEKIDYKQIGYVSQMSYLYDGSVKMNLQLAHENATDEEMMKVLEKVGLSNIKLDANANLLSIGQKQRINIGRILLRNPSIVFLDEPTSALDSNTANEIINLIFNIFKEKIVIFIDHSQKARNYCNVIVTMSNGSIQ
jgi:ABC-type transport system involved in cytochrome bd biosynthesis fused ATPase/permease subunit